MQFAIVPRGLLNEKIFHRWLKRAKNRLNESSLVAVVDVTLGGVVVVADRHDDGDVGERRFAVARRRRQVYRVLQNFG